jgi:hypothetical protein
MNTIKSCHSLVASWERGLWPPPQSSPQSSAWVEAPLNLTMLWEAEEVPAHGKAWGV